MGVPGGEENGDRGKKKTEKGKNKDPPRKQKIKGRIRFEKQVRQKGRPEKARKEPRKESIKVWVLGSLKIDDC